MTSLGTAAETDGTQYPGRGRRAYPPGQRAVGGQGVQSSPAPHAQRPRNGEVALSHTPLVVVGSMKRPEMEHDSTYLTPLRAETDATTPARTDAGTRDESVAAAAELRGRKRYVDTAACGSNGSAVASTGTEGRMQR